MTNLEQRIARINPVYLEEFDNLIKNHTQFGGGAEEEKYLKGRSFSNAYEFYMYAFYIGVSIDECIELLPEDKTKKFWELDNWKPKNIAQHLIACAIAETDFHMNEIEANDEDYVTKEVKKLKDTIEGYANAGFRHIKEVLAENPDFESDDTFFIRLIGEIGSDI